MNRARKKIPSVWKGLMWPLCVVILNGHSGLEKINSKQKLQVAKKVISKKLFPAEFA